jgi:hypothetical protein
MNAVEQAYIDSMVQDGFDHEEIIYRIKQAVGMAISEDALDYLSVQAE